jgi:hypothetical protein
MCSRMWKQRYITCVCVSCARDLPVAGHHHGDGSGLLLHREPASRRHRGVQVKICISRISIK